MIHFYFVRHGLSQLNIEGKFAGHTDTPLVDKGKKQAKSTGKNAQKLGIEYIISSPLIRAYDTAKLIAKEIKYPESKIEVNPLFIERYFGSLENTPYKPDVNIDGIADAEKSDVLLSRAEQAISYLKSLPYKKILVISHGSTGRAFKQIFEDIPMEISGPIPNSEIIEWIIN